MSSKVIRLASLLTVAALLLTTASGCKKKTVTTSSILEFVEDDDKTGNGGGQGNGSAQENNSTVSGSGGSTVSGSGGSSNHVSSGKVDPKKYRGSTVTYVTWKDPKYNEDGPVVEAFEKEYGIKVKIQLVNQKNYISTIAGNIASGTQGDVIFENDFFPSSLTVMEPLDKACLDLADPIWDKVTLKRYTIDGHPFILNTVSNVWSEVDICVYNKQLFETNGITTPAEYYKNGKWTMATFKKACQEIKALGANYLGAAVLGDAFLGGCGQSFFKFENGHFVSGINDNLYKTMGFLAELSSAGLINPGRENFSDGKTGMAITNCFALKKTGYFSTMNPKNIGATYLPRLDENSPQVTCGMSRGWGLIRGCKNPVAAGLFLRYYLDVNNYDLSETFQSSELEKFFFEATEASYKNKEVYYDYALMSSTGGSVRYAYEYERSASDMRKYIDEQKPVINKMINDANAIIETEKKWLKNKYK